MSDVRATATGRTVPAAGRRADRARARARSRADARRRPSIRLGVAPALALLAAAGLLMIASGNNASRDGDSGALLFWAGLALIYGPIALRLLSVSASREERITLALTLGASLFLVKVLRNPTGFDNFDELGTWRATHDVVQSGNFFAYNPIVVSTAGFPGLEAVTAALSELSGLSIFHAGLIVVGSARVALILGLFLFLERITGSTRGAGIGVALYACNPSFLYFDSQFAYESLALASAAAIILAVRRWVDLDDEDPRWAGILSAIVLLGFALVVTHHITTIMVIVFLALWGILAAREQRSRPINARPAVDLSPPSPYVMLLQGPALPALVIASAAVYWFTFVAGGVTVDELEGIVTGVVDSGIRLIFGGTGPKTLFEGGGEGNTLPARALAVGAVIGMLALIPLGLKRTWRAADSTPLWRALALTATLYPLTLGLRFTLASSELSQRASEFVFLGLAFFAAILAKDLRWTGRAVRRVVLALGLACAGTVLFLGGFVIGEMPATRQPGSYLVGAGARTITPEGQAAARFAASHLPPDSRTIVDRVNSELIGSYGDLRPVFGFFNDIPVPHVLFSRNFDRADRRVIHGHSVAFIVVDGRLSFGVPILGYYVEIDEPNAFTREDPIRLRSLRKFHRVRDLDRIYSNGPIVIYDSRALIGPRR